MNLQALQSKLNKGETDKTKEVVVILNNQEYDIMGLSTSARTTHLIVEKKKA